MRILSTESHLSEGNQFSRSIQLPNGINICDYLFRYINNSYFEFWGPCLVVWFLPFLPHSLSLFCVLGGKSLVRVKRKKLGQHPNTLKWYSERVNVCKMCFCSTLKNPFLWHPLVPLCPSCNTQSLMIWLGGAGVRGMVGLERAGNFQMPTEVVLIWVTPKQTLRQGCGRKQFI